MLENMIFAQIHISIMDNGVSHFLVYVANVQYYAQLNTQT